MPRLWLPQADSFSSADAITISSPCIACEASSAHSPVLGLCCAIWEAMCSGNQRSFFLLTAGQLGPPSSQGRKGKVICLSVHNPLKFLHEHYQWAEAGACCFGQADVAICTNSPAYPHHALEMRKMFFRNVWDRIFNPCSPVWDACLL